MEEEKSDKQVVTGGYHRPVCKKDNCEMRPETNGVGVLDVTSRGSYQLWDADLWKCPKCGVEIVGGFGHGPVSAHYLDGFHEHIKWYRDRELLIENREIVGGE
jgi:hypothetical protein